MDELINLRCNQTYLGTNLLNQNIFDLHPAVISYHAKLIKKLVIRSDHGQCNASLARDFLPEIQRAIQYTRFHPDCKSRRGPYSTAGYSFSNGYAQVTHSMRTHKQLGLNSTTFDKSRRTIQATHIILLAGKQIPPSEGRQFYQASHLCGNKGCLRLEHLVWETIDTNFSRKMCHVFGAYEVCPHNPQCILRAPFYKNQVA